MLPSGTRIAIRATRYTFRDGIQVWSADFATSAGMILYPFRYDRSDPICDFIRADETMGGLGALFTVESWPAADGEFFRTGSYTKCILQAENGKYLESDSAGALKASAERDAARVFCIIDDPSYGSMICDAGYCYGRRETMDRSLGRNMQDGMYTLKPVGAPPNYPTMLSVIQGVSGLQIIVVDTLEQA